MTQYSSIPFYALLFLSYFNSFASLKIPIFPLASSIWVPFSTSCFPRPPINEYAGSGDNILNSLIFILLS